MFYSELVNVQLSDFFAGLRLLVAVSVTYSSKKVLTDTIKTKMIDRHETLKSIANKKSLYFSMRKVYGTEKFCLANVQKLELGPKN